MSRVMAQGDFRPMAQNRQAMADLVAILDARRADYARAEAEVDTSGEAVEQSFAKLLRIVTPLLGQSAAMTLADAGFLDLAAAAARIPHDRAAARCGADHRDAA